MVRIVLGVIVGFIAWSILWLGSDQVLRSASPGWYGAHELRLENAKINETPFAADTMILILHLLRSVIISFMSGFLAAVVANESKKTTLVLGILLLAFGIFFQLDVWKFIPIWYHFLFLFLLIPMTMMGGKLKRST
jgi:uncharacterized membrane protein YeaQ/YmgE (transglycosylase-associated protein family)